MAQIMQGLSYKVCSIIYASFLLLGSFIPFLVRYIHHHKLATYFYTVKKCEILLYYVVSQTECVPGRTFSNTFSSSKARSTVQTVLESARKGTNDH